MILRVGGKLDLEGVGGGGGGSRLNPLGLIALIFAKLNFMCFHY